MAEAKHIRIGWSLLVLHIMISPEPGSWVRNMGISHHLFSRIKLISALIFYTARSDFPSVAVQYWMSDSQRWKSIPSIQSSVWKRALGWSSSPSRKENLEEKFSLSAVKKKRLSAVNRTVQFPVQALCPVNSCHQSLRPETESGL